MLLEKQSPCKINLLLNILGRRADGFHELETVIHPISLFDLLSFERIGQGLQLSCSNASLPADSQNLVHRVASAFLEAAKITDGVQIHLEKHLPLAAGLGGGSGNAATTLLALNELFDAPLSSEQLHAIAAGLGSDIPFFLQTRPALATGRGERIQPLDFFPAFRGAWLVLIYPGFGIPTPWAYQQLQRFPAALNGTKGRAQHLISKLQRNDLVAAAAGFYNSLAAPALEKYPLLDLFQEFLRANGAMATLMSGSGSSTFALLPNKVAAEALCERVKSKFGETNWLGLVAA